MRTRTLIILASSYGTLLLGIGLGYLGFKTSLVMLPLWAGVVAHEFISAYRERSWELNRDQIQEAVAGKIKEALSNSTILGE